MSRFKRENQLDMEQILVAYCPDGTDQGFVKGDPLVDNTTSLGIADGQLGVLSWDYNGTVPFGTFLSGGETPKEVRAIKILQGTPASSNTALADPWEIGDKAYVETGIIYRDNVRSVTVQKCRPKKLSSWAATDLPEPCDDTEYRFFGALNSARLLKEYGYNGKNVHGSFETPCYSALGTVDPKDHLLQNILFDFNKQSSLAVNAMGSSFGSAGVVAFAINTAGGAGVELGSVTCGTEIEFQCDDVKFCEPGCTPPGPVTSRIVADLPLVRSLACVIAKMDSAAGGTAVAPITAASTIEKIDLSTAGTAPNVDAFIIVALEEKPSRGIDTVPQTLPSISGNLQAGFRTEPGAYIACCAPDEGVGHGRNWMIQNDRRWQRNIHTMYVNSDRGSLSLSEGVKYIDSNKNYTSIIIDYYDAEENGITLQEQTSKQAIILTCCGYECVDVATVSANAITNICQPYCDRVDLVPTTEVMCCPVCDPSAPAADLQADLATVLLTWLKEADCMFNNGIDFNDTNYNSGPSELFAAAAIPPCS